MIAENFLERILWKSAKNGFVPLFQGFVGEDVPGDGYGQCDEHCFYPDGFADGDGAIGEGYPHHGHGDDFGAEGDGAVFAEVADVGAQVFLVDEPLV